MKERPILFSAPMVCAILDGSKTQTRRAMNPQPVKWCQGLSLPKYSATPLAEFILGAPIFACPYGKAGDQLWVRETWRGWVCINPPSESRQLGVARYVPAQMECKKLDYKATQAADTEPYRPSIHMPRWASRIQLEITGVRVERLQDITENDAAAEGFDNSKSAAAIELGWYEKPRAAFMRTWDQIYSNWDANPWVWVVEFKRVGASA